ncbi:MAG TPA: polyphenol oxidase family protein [Labilithrix sp.]|nr:polyphenol oxidase family protein [Labilithrix sp.]
MLPILQSKSLSEAGFSHGFTTRQGGVSPPPYDTLDFALLRAPALLRENQIRLAEAVGFDVGVLHQAKQVHGPELLVARGDPTATVKLEADALAAEPGTRHAVAVRVADCVPVLIADRASGRVAAVHAGWRGVEAGVVRVSVGHLAEAPGAGRPQSFAAAIGPCIGACCFEVGSDVAERIAAASTHEVVTRRVGDKAFVDLRAAVRFQLRSLGLTDDAIDDVPGRGPAGCTRCDRARFYSYRRDGDASGRLVGVIVARSFESG